MTIEELEQREHIKALLITYARACDERNWQSLDTVFDADVTANYGGEFELQGRTTLLTMIKSLLGGCGPTQHLLGNFDISVSGDSAKSRCYVRAVHAGEGAMAETYYEVWAEYEDELTHSAEGWRITHRRMHVHKEVGSREILQPA